jgi:hypothetical protein
MLANLTRSISAKSIKIPTAVDNLWKKGPNYIEVRRKSRFSRHISPRHSGRSPESPYDATAPWGPSRLGPRKSQVLRCQAPKPLKSLTQRAIDLA